MRVWYLSHFLATKAKMINLSPAAVVIGALNVNLFLFHSDALEQPRDP